MSASNSARADIAANRANARSRDAGRRLSWVLAGTWAVIIGVGAYLRWSYPELTEFGIDQQTAVHLGRVIRNGWEFPLAGIRSGVGAVAGATEYYLMAVPQFFSEAPEFAAAYIGLLSQLHSLGIT